MELGKRILNLRKAKNMTQEDLGEILFVTRQTISSWENGNSFPDLESLIKISDYFNITLDKLLKEDKQIVKEYDQRLKKSKKFKLIAIILSILIVLVIGISIFINQKLVAESRKLSYTLSRESKFTGKFNGLVETGVMDVKVDGTYYIEIDAKTNHGELVVLITNSTGYKKIYQITDSTIRENQELSLKKGSYSVSVSLKNNKEEVVNLNYALNITS